ncbi:hypothetical protein LPUS_05981 [Lasallia pustulata]|uniref:Uncharacterized protein n=1 Tax=Lasallia pustulata TaxID=136370 RepID=A0A1W5CZX1_9LECA|nr:hypothetical protein LPUS_05981 [Lasallia pustulata]
MIQTPHTLVNLPVSLHASQSKTFAADVHTLVGSRKRKRPELAVALDHEGVNIYDIRSSRLSTSYSVSPQCSFTCPPSSVRRRPNGPEPALRLTYCSVKDPKPRIQCFAEKYETASQQGSQISSSALNIKGSSSPVVHLEALSENDDEKELGNAGVLVVHENSEVRWLSQNLEREKWKAVAVQGVAESGIAPKAQVEYGVVLESRQAQKSLLRSREDVVAILEANTGMALGKEGLKLLLLITRNQAPSADEALHLRVFSLKLGAPTKDVISSTSTKPLQEIISFPLPEPDNLRPPGGNSMFAFHSASGVLHQYSEGAIAQYDLTGSSPRLSHYMHTGPNSITSCLRLSNSTVMTTSSTSISVLDMQYRSVQDSLLFHPQNDTSSNPSQSTLLGQHATAGAHLLSYYAPLNLAVAILGRKLVAYHVESPELHSSGIRKRKRRGLLADSIGRGIKSTQPLHSQNSATRNVPNALGSYLPSSRILGDQWESMIATMDRYIMQKDVEGFEKFMASQPIFSKTVVEVRDDLDQFAVPMKFNTIDRRIILYLLSKIFTLDPDTLAGLNGGHGAHVNLRISFFTPKLFQWLVGGGGFTGQMVEASLRDRGSLLQIDRLPVGAFVRALADFDTSLETLSLVLESSSHVDVEEVIYALGMVTRILQTPSSPDGTELITNGENGVQGDPDEAMQLTTPTATSDVEEVPSTARDGSTAQALFGMCLTRLNAFHDAQVTKALRRHSSKDGLISLVHLLRMELARSGWLSHYMDDEYAPIVSEDQAEDKLSILAKVLNCVVDAIGTGGWIAGNASAGDLMETEDTIIYMKAEVSAALEGIEEATYMKGLLGEILLFGKSVSTQPKPPKVSDASQIPHKVKPITIPLGSIQENILPLGLKAPQGVSQTKVGAGGEIQERSKRDIGRLKSKMVGKYSFERIII